MPKIVPIVEGPGEEAAVPILFQKILKPLRRYDIQIARPYNAKGRDNLKKKGGLERFVEAAWKERDCGAIFIVLDAEDESYCKLAKDFSTRVNALWVRYPVVIVVANRMYENWLVASIETIAGQFGLPAGLSPPEDVESIKNAKRWLKDHFPKDQAYKETTHQEAMTHLLDIELARKRSRSFQRLLHAMQQALDAIDKGAKIVTP
ncbi:MAG: DUF4276 family protein [Acidobacteriota bacterium]